MKIKLLVFSFAIISLCSCAELKDLWTSHKYVEHISHVLRTEDGSKIVIVGDKYHYVFINQHSLSELIKWEQKNILEFKFNEHFKLSPQNKLTGNYIVTCKCNNATHEQINWLRSKGFNQSSDKQFAYYREDSISGTLYLSNNTDLSKYEKINKKYEVTVESRHAFDTLAKIAFTPVALVIDVGNAVIYGSALVIATPFIAFDNLGDKEKY